MVQVLRRLLVGLVALILLVGLSIYLLSNRRLQQRYPVPAEAPLTLRADSATIARGQHLFLATSVCAHCHGVDAAGGADAEINPVFIMSPPNLTRGNGGVGASLSLADFERALRHGIRADSTSLMVMPSYVYAELSDEDVVALYAYLQQVPPVDRSPGPTGVGPIGRALLAAGKLPVQVAPRVKAHAGTAASVVDQGRYLVTISGCYACHNASLSGGTIPGEPPDRPAARNITPAGIGQWSEADFVRAMREGKRPDGTTLDTFMPWQHFRNMTEEEMHALWEYVRSVPPRETGEL
ncbi:MAG TPA: c-type cytochrome [Gemmatimonadales bacterium]|nr:c-type cytochrome [Gemmatimonadales bacterium]